MNLKGYVAAVKRDLSNPFSNAARKGWTGALKNNGLEH